MARTSAITGRFAAPDFSQLGVTPTQIAWDQASLVLGLSGVRAVNAASLKAAGSERQIEAGVLPYHPFDEGIRAALPLQTIGAGPQPFDFDLQLSLNGREHIAFQPLGRQSRDHGQERLAASELHRHAAADRAHDHGGRVQRDLARSPTSPPARRSPG